jgi:hypothetical protein
MANKVKFKINGDTFNTFVSKLSDLSTIDDSVRLKIDNDDVLMYSILGKNILLAFKNYLIPTDEFLIKNDDLDYQLDLVIPNIKKFVKNLGMIKDPDKVTIEFNYKPSADDRDIYQVRYFQVSCGRFKINWVGGEHNNETREINKEMLAKNLNLKNSKWSFALTKDDFTDIKKLSSINSERIINIGIDKGIVNFSEKSAWDLEVDNLEDDRSSNLIFNKRFLNCINAEREKITFSIFETFMLVKDEESNLMLSFEQDFEEDDI